MEQREHRPALDLRVPVRHGHGRLFVAAGQQLRQLVAAVVDDRFVQAVETGARIRGDVLEPERLDHVHHEVGRGMLDDSRSAARRGRFGIGPQLGIRRRSRRRAGGSFRRLWKRHGRLGDQRRGADSRTSQKTTTIDGTLRRFSHRSLLLEHRQYAIGPSRGSIHQSTTDVWGGRGTWTSARGEPFDSPLILSLSKDERLAQDRLVEPPAKPLVLRQAQDERVLRGYAESRW